MKFWRNNHLTSRRNHERRLDKRMSSTIPAAICWDNDKSVNCTISNLSLTGMLLETGNADCPKDTAAKIFFYCNIDGAKKRCCEWVRVVGNRNDGVAVCFTHFDNEHQSNIQLMLHDLYDSPFEYQQQKPIASKASTARDNTALSA